MINNLKKVLNNSTVCVETIQYIAGFNINALVDNTLVDINHLESHLKFDNIKDKLLQIDNKKFQIVFFAHEEHCVIQEIIEKLIDYLQMPIVYFISEHDDIFKLPNYGTWRLLEDSFILDKEKSFFVGNNYGLLSKIRNTRKGFSDLDSSDMKFARNINIIFYTPEEYFQNIPKSMHILLDTYGINPLRKSATFGAYRKSPPYKPIKREFILCIGGPSSGKTHHISRNYNLMYYHHIEAKYFDDDYIKKTIQSCQNQGKSIILEGDYETKKKREAILALLKSPIYKKCINLNVGIDLSRHLNNYHMKKTNNPKYLFEQIEKYKNNYEYPYFYEGFDEVVDIPFQAHFNNMNDYILFFEYS